MKHHTRLEVLDAARKEAQATGHRHAVKQHPTLGYWVAWVNDRKMLCPITRGTTTPA